MEMCVLFIAGANSLSHQPIQSIPLFINWFRLFSHLNPSPQFNLQNEWICWVFFFFFSFSFSFNSWNPSISATDIRNTQISWRFVRIQHCQSMLYLREEKKSHKIYSFTWNPLNAWRRQCSVQKKRWFHCWIPLNWYAVLCDFRLDDRHNPISINSLNILNAWNYADSVTVATVAIACVTVY